jgi:hypothetical protein
VKRARSRGASLRYALAALALACTVSAFAAHPLITEETGTQGSGRFEFENGFQWTRERDLREFEYGPQLSYGALGNLDLIVRPTWVEQRTIASAGGGRESGVGDTALDVKWRFLEREPWSFGTRAGIALPTGNRDKDLGAGRASLHALLIATLEVDALAVHANAGYTRSGDDSEKRDQFLAALAAVWTAHERVKVTLDVATMSNSDPTRSTWPAVVRAGTIVTIAQGLDVDAGYQTRLDRAAPERIVLVGVTYHW